MARFAGELSRQLGEDKRTGSMLEQARFMRIPCMRNVYCLLL